LYDQSHISLVDAPGEKLTDEGTVTLPANVDIDFPIADLPAGDWYAHIILSKDWGSIPTYGGSGSLTVRGMVPTYAPAGTINRSGEVAVYLPDLELSDVFNVRSGSTGWTGIADVEYVQLVNLAKAKSDPWDIWIFAGQSNMSGSSSLSNYDPYIDGWSDERMLYIPGVTYQHWATTQHVVHPMAGPLQHTAGNQNGVGPGQGFAKQIVKIMSPNRAFCGVACGWGGTGLVGAAAAWNPAGSSPTAYNAMIAATQAAFNQAPAGSKLRGLLWCQGEADTSANMSAYGPTFAAMRAQMEIDLGVDQFPVVILSTLPERDNPNQQALLDYQEGMATDSGQPQAQPLCWHVMRPLGYPEADLLHSTVEGQRIAGALVATLVENEVYPVNAGVDLP
jgi:hypothetical protein